MAVKTEREREREHMHGPVNKFFTVVLFQLPFNYSWQTLMDRFKDCGK